MPERYDLGGGGGYGGAYIPPAPPIGRTHFPIPRPPIPAPVPPPNPQIGVEVLPPPNTTDPAPLPSGEITPEIPTPDLPPAPWPPNDVEPGSPNYDLPYPDILTPQGDLPPGIPAEEYAPYRRYEREGYDVEEFCGDFPNSQICKLLFPSGNPMGQVRPTTPRAPPLPTAPPPAPQPPVTTTPEPVFEPMDIIRHDYEGFDLPGEYTTIRIPRPVIPGELVRRAVPRVLRGIGRILTGMNPVGIIIEALTPGSALGPTVLGSGELGPDDLGVQLPPSAVRLPMPPPAPREPEPPALPDEIIVTGARSSTPPQPAPNPSPAPTRSSQTLPGRARALWPILAVFGSELISRPSQTRHRTFLQPTPTPTPTPFPIPAPIDPLTPPLPTPGTDPLTPIPGLQPLTWTQGDVSQYLPPTTRTRTRTKECKCDPPKKRKKPRECLARGQLVWSSGPRKGKPAGSRCINFK